MSTSTPIQKHESVLPHDSGPVTVRSRTGLWLSRDAVCPCSWMRYENSWTILLNLNKL